MDIPEDPSHCLHLVWTGRPSYLPIASYKDGKAYVVVATAVTVPEVFKKLASVFFTFFVDVCSASGLCDVVADVG